MIRRDLLHALRLHARRPLLTAAAVATLALGIGTNSAIFSIVHGVLKPLGYPRSGELVRLYHTYDVLKSSPNARLRAIWNRLPVSYLNTLDWRRTSRRLAAVGLYMEWTATFTAGEEPVELTVSRVDAGLFEVLGVEPALGRVFEPEEIEQRQRRVILSHGFWREVHGGDPDVLGRSLQLNDQLYTVVGVMPAGFRIAGRGDDRLWVPIHWTDRDRQARDEWRYHALARLAPGVSFDRASREMTAITGRLVEAHPEENEGLGVRLVPLLESVVGDSRAMLLLLAGAVVVVLLIACVNVAHLLLAQAANRRQELAVRAALGASRRRLAGQLLAESLLLASAGGLAGGLLAMPGRSALLAWIPADLPRTGDIAVDRDLLLFTLAISLLAALAAGILPALLGSRVSPEDLGAGRGPAGAAGAGGQFVHGGFVVVEIALTLMLTAAAGLLVTSFLRLVAVEPGFDSRDVLVQEIQLPDWRYREKFEREAFAQRLLRRLAGLPGVESAALTTKLPLPGPSLLGGFRIPGRDAESEESWTQGRSAALKLVTPDYFRTLGIPLLSGRVFTSSDSSDSIPGVVINRTLAEQHWPREDAVGQTVLMRGEESYTVIGVVGGVLQDRVDTAPRALMYFAWSQPWEPIPDRVMFAVLRVAGEPADHAPAVRRAVREIDPLLPLKAAVAMDELLSRSLSAPRSRTTLVGLFAVLALALSLIGTYAVTSFTLSRRVREIGIRMALGASAGRVRSLVLRRTLQLALLGISLGTVGALACSKLLRGLLYGVEATDPVRLAAAAALIAGASLLAGYLPAERASRIDPARALRSE